MDPADRAACRRSSLLHNLANRLLAICLSLGICVEAEAQSSRYNFINIADTNEFDGFSDHPAISDSASLAFRAWDGGQGIVSTLAAKGAGYTYLTGGTTYSVTFDPVISSGGLVAFYAWVDGTKRAIVRAGASPPELADNTGIFSDFSFPTVSPFGRVLFSASFDAGGQGIYTKSTNINQPLVEVANTSGPFASFGRPIIQQNGLYAFRGVPDSGPIGLFLKSVFNDDTTTIVDTGGQFSDFDRILDLNNTGTVAFYADTDAAESGIYTAPTTAGAMATPVAESTGPFANFIHSTSDVYGPIPLFAINDAGTVVFYANLDAGGFGIFEGPDPVEDEIIGSGDPLFGSTVTELAFSHASFNNLGQLSFYYALADGRSGIAVASPDGPVALYPKRIHRLAADPFRPRVYGTAPEENAVVVINTETLELISTIPIGSTPLGLAISADGKKLWVANSGAPEEAIGVIDLETLTALSSFSAPKRAAAVVEGLNDRLYVLPAYGETDYRIMQVDARTGVFQKYLGTHDLYLGGENFLEITPDRRTLLFGSSSPQILKFDVSTADPVVTQSDDETGGGGIGLRINHRGTSFVYPNHVGNGGPESVENRTFLLSVSDIHVVQGEFQLDANPSAATFSNDDERLYHARVEVADVQVAIQVFDTETFSLVDTLRVEPPYLNSTVFGVTDMVVDRSGEHLFVATTRYAPNFSFTGDLRVLKTRRSDPFPVPLLANVSTRSRVGVTDNVMIGGFIILGNEPKKVLLRALGPSLSQAGVSGVLANPQMSLHNSTGAIIGTNDNWQTTQIGGVIQANQASEIQNSGAPPGNSAESALIAVLEPGTYTAIVRGVNNTTGVAIVEAYDIGLAADAKMANISTRGHVQTGDNVMIGGTLVLGGVPANVLIRAIGPSLTDQGVANALQNPTLELFDSNGMLVISNDNWRDTQEAEIEATGAAPTMDAESAMVVTLPPGVHTAIVRGKDKTVGVGLVEIYQLFQ